MKEIWLRFKLQAPLFFQRLQRIALGLCAAGIAITAAVPSLNIVVWVLNKGTEYQDVIRLGPLMAAVTAGIAAASALPVSDKNKQILRQELQKE